MNGILLVDKPQGWTSFDAVNKVRRLIQYSPLNETGKKRFPVGHTGTLDPMATGLLVLLLGKYTKRAPELTKLEKTYEVTMRLGITSTTGDEEGDKTIVSAERPTKSQIEQALQQFVGDIMQIPPIYSAIKIDGKRAYKLAREGKEVKMTARPVRVEYIKLTGYSYPDVCFTTLVSSGTYIRSLVEDIGGVLNTGAYMSGLRRTTVGPFTIANAIGVKNIDTAAIQAHAADLTPVE
jgi:tRNA pseudouridine55 synthase